MEINVTAPVLLTDEHILQPFDCGNEVLSNWLHGRAMKNQMLNASRTFVICLEGTLRVVGYYSLATGSVTHAELGRSLRHNMPNPVPVVLLGRLAVDVCTQGHGFGKWPFIGLSIWLIRLVLRLLWFMQLMMMPERFMSVLVLSNQLWHQIPCFIKSEQFYCDIIL